MKSTFGSLEPAKRGDAEAEELNGPRLWVCNVCWLVWCCWGKLGWGDGAVLTRGSEGVISRAPPRIGLPRKGG